MITKSTKKEPKVSDIVVEIPKNVEKKDDNDKLKIFEKKELKSFDNEEREKKFSTVFKEKKGEENDENDEKKTPTLGKK